MTDYWKSTQNMYYCEYCKVWNKDDPRARMTHENGAKHKLEVAKRMRAMMVNADNEKKEKELAAKSIDKIELLARRQYERDLAAGIGAADKVSTYEEAIGPALPSAKETGGAGGKPEVKDETTWVFDKDTGYYYNAKAGFYYHKESKMYYGGEPVAWVKDLPPHLAHLSYGEGVKATIVSVDQVVKEKVVQRTEVKTHPLAQVGGITMSSVQGGTVGAARGLAGATAGPGSAALASKAGGLGAKGGAQVGQKRKEMEASMDPVKLEKLKKEEAEAQARREAAKARLQQKQAGYFGLV